MSTSADHVTDPPFFDIRTFCDAHQLSRAFLYQLWSAGKGPQRTKIGRRTLISREAAREWRRQIQNETSRVASSPASSG